MKKTIMIIIITTLITGIISIGCTYAATTYAISASKVGYSDNSSLGAANVQAAIDGTCSKVNEVLNNKIDKSFKEISLPTPTIVAVSNKNKSVSYDIDLSKYIEIVPVINIKDVTVYSTTIYPLPFNDSMVMNSALSVTVAGTDHTWSGFILISSKNISVYTNPGSYNIDSNYFEIIKLYAR